MGELGYAYAIAGRIEAAEAQLERLLRYSRRGEDSAYSLALIHLGLGKVPEVFEWLDRAYGERDFRLIRLLVDPIWDELRGDPRFGDLVVRIGLAPGRSLGYSL